MSQLFVDDVVSKEGTNSVGFSKGISVSVASTFSGDVSIGGTLTYEDVTNIDVVGLITARNGLKIGAAGIGGTIAANGNTTLAGVVTATSFSGAATGLTGVPGGQITGALAAVDGSALTGMANTANVNTAGLNVVGVTTFNNDVTFKGDSYDLLWDKSTDDLKFPNNSAAKFGTSALSISHNGTDSYIANDVGHLILGAGNGTSVKLQPEGGEDGLTVTHNGSVDLYFNNAKKFETTNSGTITTGISTVTVGTDLKGFKVESGNYSGGALNGEFDFTLEDGHVWTVVGSTGGTYFPDFKVSSSKSLSSIMNVGDTVTATLIAAASNTAHYCTAGIKIDDSTSNVTVEWIGSSAPSAGKGAGYDIYTFTIVKTAATPGYLVIVNATDAG
tara:strand:- start:1077 stop:2240 length:1164 start_codon:yes stop_codon:yes gene_type:complete